MCSANPLLVMAACTRPVLIALLTLVASANVFAATLSTPLGIGYPMLTRLLQEQIFNGPGHSASMYADELRCNTLELAEPAVSSDGNGRLRVLSNASFRIGTPLAGKCVFPLAWNGRLELMQQAYIENDGSTLAFRVVDSRLLSDDKDQASVPSAVWGWVSDRVHPRMESLKINLAPGMADTEALLRQGVPAIASFTPTNDRLMSLGRVDVTEDQLVVQLDIAIPDASTVAPLPAAQPALSDAELAQWDASWQAWDGFATWLIMHLAQSAGPEVGDELADALLDARYDLRDALANDSRDDDVVRALFMKTWSRLAPLLRDVSADVAGVQALQLATFVSAGDALATIDQAAPYLGFRIDSDNLRRLARLMSPGVTPAQLEYSAEVDPALRRLLGLEPDFDAEGAQAGRPFDWLIPSAHAGQVDAALVQKLTHWVPAPPELDNYLSTVNALLEEVAAQEQAKPKVPAAYHSIYRNLLLATAWKETCWRQFVRNKGAVETIRSKGGAIGLMQINQHVWRGVYDIDRLNTDIGYNARAGNEILVHYLVDVALRKKEHERSGSAENLARATYAAYNGGPGQLTRYRNPSASKGARAVDAAFWKRYQAIGSDGYLAVRQCYSG